MFGFDAAAGKCGSNGDAGKNPKPPRKVPGATHVQLVFSIGSSLGPKKSAWIGSNPRGPPNDTTAFAIRFSIGLRTVFRIRVGEIHWRPSHKTQIPGGVFKTGA